MNYVDNQSTGTETAKMKFLFFSIYLAFSFLSKILFK
jgi:hypothetical protein